MKTKMDDIQKDFINYIQCHDQQAINFSLQWLEHRTKKGTGRALLWDHYQSRPLRVIRARSTDVAVSYDGRWPPHTAATLANTVIDHSSPHPIEIVDASSLSK
ncbi:unnamed protein product [Arctia plantaginis]|uniref:Uncharacterized protein n=1 Tax=Arctia plantaginis TaxID=874455 RepID=A0A8S1BLB3_ARCPL|nr:unnamed protein product [Arctia plantaginis]